MSLLQKITHHRSNCSGSKRFKKAFGVSCKETNKDDNIVEHESRDEDTKYNRSQSDLTNQLIHISNESYNEGVNLLSSKRYEDSREFFEACLNARLVLNMNHECLIEVHRQLEHIANIQEDRKKEAYHQHRIHHIYSARKSARILSQNRYTSGDVDWSRV